MPTLSCRRAFEPLDIHPGMRMSPSMRQDDPFQRTILSRTILVHVHYIGWCRMCQYFRL
jgi:hypothetical protein